MSLTISQVAEIVNGKIIGDANRTIEKLANISTAKENELTFLSDKKMRQFLSTTKAAAVIVKEQDVPENAQTTIVVVADPYVAFAKIAQALDTTPCCADGIHSSAVVDSTVVLGKNVSIGANAVIESGVELGNNVQIGANCFVGKNTKIGDNTKLWANVSIYHNCLIGSNCLFQSGAVIGSDGFGYANERGKWIKIPQIGRVVIGNSVEIGANTTVDRGALDDTIIEDNVIIDNQVQIAHNVKIGFGSAIAGCTTFAGSVELGKFCIVGGTSVFNGHIKICDGVQVLGQVAKDISEPGKYHSYLPVQKAPSWLRTQAIIAKLPEMSSRLRKLEDAVYAQGAKEDK